MKRVRPVSQVAAFDSGGRSFFVSDINAVKEYAEESSRNRWKTADSTNVLYESIITALKCGYVIGKAER